MDKKHKNTEREQDGQAEESAGEHVQLATVGDMDVSDYGAEIYTLDDTVMKAEKADQDSPTGQQMDGGRTPLQKRDRISHKIIDITEEIRRSYCTSTNLKRDIREEANRVVKQIINDITYIIGIDDADEHTIDRALTLWPTRIGEVMFLVSESRRFSRKIICTMEELRDEGQYLLQKWYDNDSLNITDEEARMKRNKWSEWKEIPAKTQSKKKKPIVSDSSQDETYSPELRQKRPKEKENEIQPDIRTESNLTTRNRTQQKIGERHPQASEAVPSGERKTTPTQLPPTTTTTTTALPQPREPGPAARHNAPPPRGDELQPPPSANPRPDPSSRKHTIRIKAEARAYAELIGDLKKRVRIDDLNVLGIKKTLHTEDALAIVDIPEGAALLKQRLEEQGTPPKFWEPD